MQWTRRGNKHLIRIALALLVAAALAPTLSRLLSFAQGTVSPWAFVCSADDAGRGDPAVGRDAMSTDQCPMCSVPVQGWHSVTEWSLWALVPAPGDLMPLLFLWVACPLFAWAAAQPRAPPAHA
jgi:hypothetical protein